MSAADSNSPSERGGNTTAASLRGSASRTTAARELLEEVRDTVHRDGEIRPVAALRELAERLERALGQQVEDPRTEAGLRTALPAVYGLLLEAEGEHSDLLTRAIEAARRAGGPSASHEHRADAACNLAALLVRRAIREPTDAHLHAAVDASRGAITAAKHGTLDHQARARGNFSYALRVRYEMQADRGDLLDAVKYGEQAVRILPSGDPSLPGAGVNWIAALARLAHDEPSEPNVDAAVEAGKTVLARTPEDHPLLYKIYSGFAGALMTRFRFRGTRTSLEQARIAYGRAYTTYERDAPTAGSDPAMRASIQASLCDTLIELFKLALAERNETQARVLSRQAVEAGELGRADVDPADPRWSVGTFNLAMAHLAAASTSRTEAEAEGHGSTALELLRALFDNPAVAIPVRLRGARWLIDLAIDLRQPEPVSQAYRTCVELLSELAFPGMNRSSQERLLATWGALTGDAFGWAAGQEWDWKEALTLAEQGRTVLWRSLAELRSPLETLREEHPLLAQEVQDVRATLDTGTAAFHSPDTAVSVTPDGLRRAASRWQELRRHPSVAALLALPDITALRERLGNQTVIYLSANRHRSTALVITRENVRPIVFDDLKPEEVHERATGLAVAVEEFRTSTPGPESAEAFARHLRGLLEWEWDAVVRRIVTSLELTGSPWITAAEAEQRARSLDRIVWCPIGAFALLPLHAAGLYGPDGPVPGQNLLERSVSSYTSTLQALTRPPVRRGKARSLLVEYGLPPTDRRLIGAPKVLSDSQATVAAVAEALGRFDTVHFACHGTQQQDVPSEAALLLADGPLRLLDIPHTSAPRDFAFLAACSTSQGGPLLPDEVLTMASAFQHAGWRRVVGTLWPVQRWASDAVVRSFYGHPGSATAATADALSSAVLKACRARPDRPDRWAGYVHVGPVGTP
ncbi:CHAT domain-containing protein [Streptomyces sp. WMMC940]|uniref:CHAT domain-containing protein n=1 Tax=Streptomyces sp. WMMC940 TaxID=3015153 RepID=UPI0022B71AC1|nr:CHAT domain-containing protein [Streptomyces sp. WMMC940]MCZ7456249.1 CHAT domain-containing protein [Streptomyces sp. WMMC940]